MKLGLVILLTIVVAGCGGYGSNYKAPGTTPGSASTIAALVPNNTGAGASSFTLTVNGTGFSANSVVFLMLSPNPLPS